jgi:hypothetical protein
MALKLRQKGFARDCRLRKKSAESNAATSSDKQEDFAESDWGVQERPL